jgi:hypothetical protein
MLSHVNRLVLLSDVTIRYSAEPLVPLLPV